MAELILALLGLLYLKIRYRDKQTMDKVLNEKYHRKLHGVGIAIVLNTVAAIGLLMIVCGIFYVIVSAVRDRI